MAWTVRGDRSANCLLVTQARTGTAGPHAALYGSHLCGRFCSLLLRILLCTQTYTHLIVIHGIIAWLDAYGLGKLQLFSMACRQQAAHAACSSIA
jgi:hypothetical protein